MQELAPNLYLLDAFPKHAINVYLMGDVLVDAATRWSAGRILRALRGRRVTAHALTHVHPDHQGASHAVCQALDIPLWCGAGGIEAMESGSLWSQLPDNPITRFLDLVWSGPPHPVARVLREGDVVAGYTVLEVPGHAPSQIAFWHEADRVLVLGDVLNHQSVASGRIGLREPPPIFTPNPALNRRSARRLAALRPGTVCFGHGPPLFDGDRFVEF